jgi:hypothetical protein
MTFTRTPRLIKGAIVALNPTSSRVERTIPFQYNPDSLSRSLQTQAIETNGARSEVLRLKGAPTETIRLEIELDATDQLERAEKVSIDLGIYPQLSALETLIYPSSDRISQNMANASLGTIEVIPLEAAMTLLVWGKKRVLPVRLTDFSITEEAYDVNLNPIRAKVSLSLRVLNYDDLPWGQRGSHLFLSHHREKERMAAMGALSNPVNLTGVDVNQL